MSWKIFCWKSFPLSSRSEEEAVWEELTKRIQMQWRLFILVYVGWQVLVAVVRTNLNISWNHDNDLNFRQQKRLWCIYCFFCLCVLFQVAFHKYVSVSCSVFKYLQLIVTFFNNIRYQLPEGISQSHYTIY